MVSLIDIFDGEVAKSPSQSCVVLEDGATYSYHQINEIASHVARELACAMESTGLTSDETPLVAVLMTRGVGLVSSILGILKAGAAYVPVDPAFPPDRQTHIFAHSKCKILITDETSLELALSLGVVVPPTLVINSSPSCAVDKISLDKLLVRSLSLPSFHHLEKETIDNIHYPSLLYHNTFWFTGGSRSVEYVRKSSIFPIESFTTSVS